MRADAQSSAGFTLVELLVALVLAALLALTALGVTTYGSRVWKISTGRAEVLTTRAAALDSLRNHWINIEPIRIEADDASPVVAFAGGPSDMRFFVRAAGPAESGVFGETLTLLTNGQASALQVSRTSQSFALSSDTWTWRESTVSWGETALAFRYFGQRTPDSTPGWRDTWNLEREPPQLIGLFAIQDGRETPIILAAPRVRASRLVARGEQLAALFPNGLGP